MRAPHCADKQARQHLLEIDGGQAGYWRQLACRRSGHYRWRFDARVTVGRQPSRVCESSSTCTRNLRPVPCSTVSSSTFGTPFRSWSSCPRSGIPCANRGRFAHPTSFSRGLTMAPGGLMLAANQPSRVCESSSTCTRNLRPVPCSTVSSSTFGTPFRSWSSCPRSGIPCANRGRFAHPTSFSRGLTMARGGLMLATNQPSLFSVQRMNPCPTHRSGHE